MQRSTLRGGAEGGEEVFVGFEREMKLKLKLKKLDCKLGFLLGRRWAMAFNQLFGGFTD